MKMGTETTKSLSLRERDCAKRQGRRACPHPAFGHPLPVGEGPAFETKFVLLVPFVLLVFLFPGQMLTQDASLSSALADLNKGRILESIAQFKQILRTDPANAPAHF